MSKCNVLLVLSQASLSEVGEVLGDHMRNVVKESLVTIMLEEAGSLCGGFHHPAKSSGYARAGSAKGIFMLNESKEPIIRPRVRRSGVPKGEVDLVSYKAGKSADALSSSVIGHFNNPIIQRCVIHKERNIRSYLSKRHHSELATLFSLLRKAEGAEAGREVVNDIRDFLKGKSKSALESLEECGEDLIALHTIGAPSTLNKTLLNTNCIENAFNNVRRKTGRVKRWRPDTNQAERWMGNPLRNA